MIELTDGMITESLRNGMIVGCVVGAIFLILGIIVLTSTIKRLRENDEKARNGEGPTETSSAATFLKNILPILFLGWGIISLAVSVRNYGAVRNGYDVYTETIMEKDSDIVRTSNNKSKTLYYFYFSSLGKQKVSSGEYDDYQEGDGVIVVMSKKDKILKMYDASEYQYVSNN